MTLHNFEEQIWQHLSRALIQTITTTGTMSQINGHQNVNRKNGHRVQTNDSMRDKNKDASTSGWSREPPRRSSIRNCLGHHGTLPLVARFFWGPRGAGTRRRGERTDPVQHAPFSKVRREGNLQCVRLPFFFSSSLVIIKRLIIMLICIFCDKS